MQANKRVTEPGRGRARGWSFGALAAAALGIALSGCTSDCEVVCGKLDACNLLVETDLFGCVDVCERRAEDAEEAVAACAGCLEDRPCDEVSAGACAPSCEDGDAP